MKPPALLQSDGAAWGFDRAVPKDGYRWWYVDAVSDDGARALTVIFFIGSVFSPYYAWARRRRGAADPAEYCACNVALYGVRGPGWAMTERGAGALRRDVGGVGIGRSAIAWRDGALEIAVDEVTFPVPRRVRGRVSVRPACLFDAPVVLDGVGRHVWSAVAPCAAVTVAFDAPGWRWGGTGYADMNWGEVPLERDFAQWSWSRASLPGGGSSIIYDATRLDGGRCEFAARYDPDGRRTLLDLPPRHDLPAGRWGVARPAHGQGVPRLLRRYEDTPFYTRSLIESDGAVGVHESLSLTRFRKPWVQMLLPFRMPRRRDG